MVTDVLRWLSDLVGVERDFLIQRLVGAVAIWVFGWFLLRLVALVGRRIVAAVNDGDQVRLSTREKRGQTIAQLIQSVGRLVVFLGATLLTFNLFLDIKPVLAGVGILGLAISFGAQSLVKDLIAGFFILFEGQFVVGDVIQVGDKAGTVERLTLRIVELRDLQGALHIVPNGTIASVTNKTRGWSRAVIDISVAYEASVDHALAVIGDELRRFRDESEWSDRFEGVSEVMGVQSLADSGVVIRVAIRTAAGAQWEAAREFQRRIKNRLDAEGIEIPFPQRTVHLRQAER